MFSTGDMDSLIKQVLNLLGQEKTGTSGLSCRTGQTNSESAGNCNNGPTGRSPLDPQRLLVILGLLSGVLEVNSILVDKDQNVELLLTGTLKRKTRLDKILEQIGGMPFDDVMQAIFDRLS